MKLIEQVWNPHLGKYTNTWLTNDESKLTAGFDPDGAVGSIVICVSGVNYMKNADGKWQKHGTSEVL